MFFKDYLNGISQSLEIKYNSYNRDGINSADIGELCELFIKEFLTDCVEDLYKVYRGGNIVNTEGSKSPQMDVILANKNTIKIFGDKGLYPIETVCGVFSITSNLTLAKLKECIVQIGKIPKKKYAFSIEKFYGFEHKKKTFDVWKNLIPYICIFGFKGDIDESWINGINYELTNVTDKSLWPAMILVNKRGMLEKSVIKNQVGEVEMKYKFTATNMEEKFGEGLSKILFHLYNYSGEQNYMRPKYENYFEQDFP
jgi:hypothetical protein